MPMRTRVAFRLGALPVVAVALALALAIAVPAAVVSHDRGTVPAHSGPRSSDQHGWRWVGYRDVEVKVPASWEDDYASARPDCIPRKATGRGPKADSADAPTAPYVTYGDAPVVVFAMACHQQRRRGDPDLVFGALPFRLWQPYVEFDEARPDLTVNGQYPEHRDADLGYRGWHLTRTTTHGIQITVLSAPGKNTLARTVLDSLRTVRTTQLGCPTDSNVLAHHPTAPIGAPLPPAKEVGAVTICDFQRGHGGMGLGGSRRIEGHQARDLTQAIHDAAPGSAPNSPTTCLQPAQTDRALVLRFFRNGATAENAVTEAYVYFDSCVGNGILEPGGMHALTKADCAPLFATPPIGMWSADSDVFSRCAGA
jgi:hypothetical protein